MIKRTIMLLGKYSKILQVKHFYVTQTSHSKYIELILYELYTDQNKNTCKKQ